MAGSVARLLYPTDRIAIVDGSTNSSTGILRNPSHKSPLHWNMELHGVLEQLRSNNDGQVSEAIQELRGLHRRHGVLPFEDPEPIFESVSELLENRSWDIKHQSLQFIQEVVPALGSDMDICMGHVLPQLAKGMGDSKITIRKTVMQTLHSYIKNTNDVQPILSAIVRFGIENGDKEVQQEVIVTLPMLLTPDLSQENFYEVVQSLAKLLLKSDSSEDLIKLALEKIKELVGERTYYAYIGRLAAPLRKYYYKRSGDKEPPNYSLDSPETKQTNSSSVSLVGSLHQNRGGDPDRSPSNGVIHIHPTHPASFRFGIVPSHIMERLHDQTNFTVRGQAVEQLKQILKDMPDKRILLPHLQGFISFLNNLLDDTNFKITTVTLEILGILVSKLERDIEPQLGSLVAALTKRMDDNKVVMRQAILKVIVQLMQIFSPKPILSVISPNLSHRNSRVRQETLNFIIASLLMFPSSDFDLGQLCQMVAPSLVDPKRQVRQASLECFAMLASTMGQGRLGSLVNAVDSVELSPDGEGVMAAVQARLSRRQLPRLNQDDGLVDYATPAPSSATARGGISQGADLDWILAASGGAGSSARSHRSDAMELESVTSSARSTPANFAQDYGPTPRRYLSAGKGKKKLPWEEELNERNNTSSRKVPGNDSAKARPPNTWAIEDYMSDETPSRKGQNLRLRQIKETARDQSPDAGYRKIYQNKYKKASPEPHIPYSHHKPHESEGGSQPRRPEELAVRSSFSNSWPESRMFDEAGKSNRRVLDPISAPDTPTGHHVDWSSYDDRKGRSIDNSPIPTKATLARGHSSRRKVPPIGTDPAAVRDDDLIDTARDSVLDGYDEEEDSREEMEKSLRPIRNSASRKKVEKIFLEKETSRTPSPSDGMDESGIFSQYSGQGNQASKRKSNKNGNPFEAKPRLARGGSQRSPKTEDYPDGRFAGKNDPGHQEGFRPHGGVTFRENRSSDVAIVGKGYAEDSQMTEAKGAGPPHPKPRERRRISKPGLMSPLAVATLHSPAADSEDSDMPEGVVGRGMFDSSSSGSDSQLHTSPTDRRDRHLLRQEQEARNPPKGVYGVGVRQNSLDRHSPDDVNSADEDDDVSVISISKTTREKAALKKQAAEAERLREEELERREEEERRKQEEEERRAREAKDRRIREEARRAREQAQQTKEEEQRLQEEAEKRLREEQRKARERQRQQEKLRRLSGAAEAEKADMGLSISSPSNKPPSGLPSPSQTPPQSRKKLNLVNGSPSLEKKFSPTADGVLVNISSRTPGEIDAADDLKPISGQSDAALKRALSLMGAEEWEEKCCGLTMVRQLVVHNPECMVPQLHTVIAAVIKEIKNLRSQVSRLAIVTMGDMFTYLKRHMDTDLDHSSKVLLGKAGETNNFIRNDVDQALSAMADNVTPQRAVGALISGGASHKNVAVRKACAQNLAAVVDRMGPGRVLSGVKDTTDKILPTAAQFAMDSSPETRYYGQKMLYMLMSHQDFERMMNKYVAANTLRNLQDKLDTLRRKGLGDPPSESTSARARRSGQGSRTGSGTRGNSAQSGTDMPSVTPTGSSRLRRNASRTDEATMESIKAMTNMMAANDWKERQRGVSQLQEMVEANPVLVGNNIIKIFDRFTPCLKDSNSKVNLLALQVMNDITAPLKDYLGNVVNMVIQTVASNLSSKNKDIHDCASETLDAFMENLDAVQILQPFCNQAQQGNARIKPDMIERVSYLVQQIYQRKPKQVMLHVLPLLWHLLGASSGSGSAVGANGQIRAATAGLVQVLYQVLGPQLLEQATSNPNVTPKHLQQLQDMVDNP